MDSVCEGALRRIVTLLDILRERIGQPDFTEWSEKELSEIMKLLEGIKSRCPELVALVESIRSLIFKLRTI